MSVRIIAGERRGAILKTPQSGETRPTLGRVRTSLFSILTPLLGDAQVLDLFAGSGALGLEAVSRGGREVYLVDQSPEALATLRANVTKLRWETRAHVMPGEVTATLRRALPPGGRAFDLVFIDPPYGVGLCDKSLGILGAGCEAWLTPDACVVAQAGKKDALLPNYGTLTQYREEHYSDTRVAFYRLQS